MYFNPAILVRDITPKPRGGGVPDLWGTALNHWSGLIWDNPKPMMGQWFEQVIPAFNQQVAPPEFTTPVSSGIPAGVTLQRINPDGKVGR
jgi:hypothetical protein